MAREQLPPKTTGKEEQHCSQGYLCPQALLNPGLSYTGKIPVLGDLNSSPASASDVPRTLEESSPLFPKPGVDTFFCKSPGSKYVRLYWLCGL